MTVLNANNEAAINQEIVSTVIGERDGFTNKTGNIRNGTKDDDYLIGTAQDDKFYPGAGNDLMSGKDGDDTYYINGTGNKIILDAKGKDTLDLNLWKKGDITQLEGATLNLVDGGDLGNDTKIQLGAYGTTGAGSTLGSKFNLMLVIDVSGSMSGTPMSQAIKAANDLLAAYDNVGDVAVRIVTFGRDDKDAGSDFNGHDSWMSVSEARNIINGLYAYGGTPYDAAMDAAQQAFVTGRNGTWFDQGSNHLFFMSDGSPNSSVYHKESAWESFLIDNKIVSNAIGFAGLQNIYHLEPIAYNGVKMEEMTPVIEANITNLGQTLIDQAKLHFIEDIVGTDFADKLTGNDLDNEMLGGKGDDIFYASKGKDRYEGGVGFDKVVYEKSLADYNVSKQGIGLKITEKADAGKTDYLHSDIECVVFNGIEHSTILQDDGELAACSQEWVFRQLLQFNKNDVGYFGNIPSLSISSNDYNINIPLDGLNFSIPGIDDIEMGKMWDLGDKFGELGAKATFKFSGLNFDGGSIEFPYEFSITPGSFDFDYRIDTLLHAEMRQPGSIAINSSIISTDQQSDFSSILPDIKALLSVKPDLRLNGSSSMVVDYAIFDESKTATLFDINFTDINQEYSIFNMPSSNQWLAQKYPLTGSIASTESSPTGRKDTKGDTFYVELNSPGFSNNLGNEVSLIEDTSDGLDNIVSLFDFNYGVSNDLLNLTFDIDDIIGQTVQGWGKLAKAFDGHLNIANITPNDYKKMSDVGKSIADIAEKIIKGDLDATASGGIALGKAILGPYSHNLPFIPEWTEEGVLKLLDKSLGGGKVSIDEANNTFKVGPLDWSIEFDYTLLGLDVNMGISPVLSFEINPQSIIYNLIATSTDDMSYSQTKNGIIGDELIINYSENINSLDLKLDYELLAEFVPKLSLQFNSSVDLYALGLEEGRIFGYDIPSLAEMGVNMGEDGHFVYSESIPLINQEFYSYAFNSIQINVPVITESYSLFLV